MIFSVSEKSCAWRGQSSVSCKSNWSQISQNIRGALFRFSNVLLYEKKRKKETKFPIFISRVRMKSYLSCLFCAIIILKEKKKKDTNRLYSSASFAGTPISKTSILHNSVSFFLCISTITELRKSIWPLTVSFSSFNLITSMSLSIKLNYYNVIDFNNCAR